MSVYPITIRFISMEHKGGTKSYNLAHIVAADSRSVVVNRWGKTGTFGDIKASHFRKEEYGKADKALTAKYREKLGNGYAETNDRFVSASDETELRRALGRMLFIKLGASTIKWLDPNIDVSGLKDAEHPSYDEDGYKVDNARRVDPRELERQLEAQKRAETEAAAAEMKSLPTYGMF